MSLKRSSTRNGEPYDQVELQPSAPNGPASPTQRQLSRPQRQSTVTTVGDTPGALPRTQTGLSRHLTDLAMTLSAHRQPEKPLAEAPGMLQSIKAICCCSWLNLLLVFIPISWAFHFAKPDSDTLIFVFSFLAIIPLAKLLGFATEELSMRLGQTVAGLLNATLGNAVELIVAIIALVKCELQVVQSSLIGSILSNLLLVLGMCFFAGGTRFSEQGFGVSAAQINSSLLIISVIAVLLPAAFHFVLTSDDVNDSTQHIGSDILRVSHGVAIILLFIYGSYLVFQLFSHKQIYADRHTDVMKSIKYAPRHKKQAADAPAPVPGTNTNAASAEGGRPSEDSTRQTHTSSTVTTGRDVEASREEEEEEEEEETPTLNVPMCIILLVIDTVLVAVTAEFLVDSINGLTATGTISTEFVGLILLPIVGNAAEHVTAVTVSVKDKLTLSIGVAVGSSIQIALFVIPFIVTLGWIIGKPLTLFFDPFESIALFLSVITVNYVVADGKSNWLEGMLLMCLYVILAVTFWFYSPAPYPYTCT